MIVMGMTRNSSTTNYRTCRERYAEKDVTLLIWDFNAKIGADNTGYEEVMGTH